MTNNLLQDARFGLRMLGKNPGFAAIAVLTLALGIGANTAIFSLVDATLLRPLPFPEPDRVMAVFNHFPDLDEGPASYADFQDWRKQNQVFDEMVAMFPRNLNWTGKGEPQRVRTGFVSDNFFRTLGMQPVQGRLFNSSNQAKGAEPVCILSFEFWQNEMGGNADAIGKTLLLNGKSYAVIGVLPAWLAADFGPLANIRVWAPLEADPPWTQRGTNYLNVVARLKPGTTLALARSQMDALQGGINAQFPGNKHDVRIVPLAESLVGNTRPILLVLLGAVGFVLLIACVNVANLLFARATGRRREFAVREALGSGRWGLIRLSLVESSLLGLVGGVLGILLAIWGIHAVMAAWPSNVTRIADARIDGRVLTFTTAMTILAVALFGAIPAVQGTRISLNEVLKEGSQKSSEGKGRRRSRGLLVVLETSLACMLLVGAGLTLKSIEKLSRVSPGFNARGVLTMKIALPGRKYSEDTKISSFYSRLFERTAALPGVRSVGGVTDLPLDDTTTGDFKIEGRAPFPPGQEPTAEKEIASPGYFETMQIPLIQGRYFEASDQAGVQKVALISESMARVFWPNQNPVGQFIDAGFGKDLPNGQPDWQQIVGVVHDIAYDSLDQKPSYAIYLCSLQYPASLELVVRTTSEPLLMAQAVKAQVFAVDPEQPVYGINSMENIVGHSIERQQDSTFLLGIFAALATLLAAVGIYGVTSYSTRQRTHEVGIRMALGADAWDVIRLVAIDGMALVLAGILLGMTGALALTRFLTSLLYGVAPTDFASFFAAFVLLTAVAFLACYIPARRATRVDPILALRYE
ncbi:MAG TPA: ABC transporter permease [Candidatus Methylomirabilis sp.]|nr:ABC transporter permease [Candidatus Methylomirabilis sp.]